MEVKEAAAAKRFSLHEDWVVVVVGFSIIAIAVGGVMLPAPKYSWNEASDLWNKIFQVHNLSKMLVQFAVLFTSAIAAATLAGKPIRGMIIVLPLVYVLSIVALILAGNGHVKDLNLEAVIFSLMIGLLIRNTIDLPPGLREALNAELFVKIGLVLLGTGVIFSDILTAGSLGLVQALLVVLSVWYFAFWVCRKLKVDEELSMMISSAVSICGVSAAIATAGAIKGDTKKLSYVVSLVLVTAIPMMIVMPYVAKYFNLPEAVTGAWLGGTIDTTGAVVASGTLVGETALKISTIVKFSQNVLLGLAAFAISVYWTYSSREKTSSTEKPTLKMIWDRFPKFVLGFVAASLLFSFVLPSGVVSSVKEGLKSLQNLWFVLAFTSIGLETKFSDLFNASSRRPLAAFLTAQAFNIVVTLLIAFMLFG